MASESSNSNGFLYFMVGAILVVLVVFGVMAYNGNQQASRDNAIEESAEAVGDTARDISRAIPETPDLNPASQQPAPAQ